MKHSIPRRSFLRSTSLASLGALSLRPSLSWALAGNPARLPLAEVGYRDVVFADGLHEQQLRDSLSVLMALDENSLLKPLRQMADQPAPGVDLGGWYHYDPNYDYHNIDTGFAPAATFGQWVSALARGYAITGSAPMRDKVLRLNRLYAETISGKFYDRNRFPAYCHDKLVCGLMDAHQWAGDPDAFAILERTTDAALPHMPGKAVDRFVSWRTEGDESYTWDESYTNSENLFIAYQRGAGERYRTLGVAYLDDAYFDALAAGQPALAGKHAYSYVNALSSAMQAYLTLGSQKHLRAAISGFDMLAAQSFATGGWGPDETLRAPNSGEVAASIETTHNSFETPCGSYAHFKLTRYLLRVTRDARYGDSMERMMYNTVLGAMPLQADGRTFYYADCNIHGRKVYSDHRWPCCSGTMPQVAADYRINAYFRDRDAVYVNLYIPSTLNWAHADGRMSLTQTSQYPFESSVTFELKAAKPAVFALVFRIPKWAQGASVAVNGRRLSAAVTPGEFMTLHRQWKSGDRVELELPLALRLEPIDDQHPNTVALLWGPQVLLPLGDERPPVTRAQLLAAKRSGAQSWVVQRDSGPMNLLPFTAIVEQAYSTYLTVG